MKITTSPQDLAAGTPEHYDDRHALATAEHAVAVYLPGTDYRHAAMIAGFQGATLLEEGAAQVGVAWHQSVILISCRGSSERGDWVADLLSTFRGKWAPPLPKECRVGIGFRDQARGIYPRLLRTLRTIRAIVPTAAVVVTGHSLGAALVPFIVSALAVDMIRARYAYMHEPPRTGNAAWRNLYDSSFTEGDTPTYMLVNVVGGKTDIVTRVPLRRHGFRHVGRRVTLDSGHAFADDRAGQKGAGWTAWQEHRASNPVSIWQGFRIITNAARSIRAHHGGRLVATLKAKVGR